MIKEIREEANNHNLGGRKLHYLLTEKLSIDDLQIGRDKLYGLMNDYGLLVRKKRRNTKTTDSNHPFKKYPNLIENATITTPESVWVSDITYLRVNAGFHYLSLITDAYSRKIVGYHLCPNLSARGPEEALLMALGQRIYPENSLIHHSDQGVQYCSHNYITLLKESKIKISMTHKGSPEENAIAERVNGILKHEYDLRKTFASSQLAKKAVIEAVESYNAKRPHMSLKMLTPNQAHGVKLNQELFGKVTNRRRNKTMRVKSKQY